MRYSINAHCEAEEMLGFPITQLEGQTGFSVFRLLLYIGLKYGGNQVTLEKAGDIMEEIINDRGMDYLSEEVGKAIEKSIMKENNNNFKRQQGQGNNKKKY